MRKHSTYIEHCQIYLEYSTRREERDDAEAQRAQRLAAAEKANCREQLRRGPRRRIRCYLEGGFFDCIPTRPRNADGKYQSVGTSLRMTNREGAALSELRRISSRQLRGEKVGAGRRNAQSDFCGIRGGLRTT
jgi:hypothetical protein